MLWEKEFMRRRKSNKQELYAQLRAGGRAVMRGTADPVHSGSNPDLPSRRDLRKIFYIPSMIMLYPSTGGFEVKLWMRNLRRL